MQAHGLHCTPLTPHSLCCLCIRSTCSLSTLGAMSFFELLGVATFVLVVGYIARVLYETFIYKCDLSQFQPAGAGKEGWALVTGCTSGIGEGSDSDSTTATATAIKRATTAATERSVRCNLHQVR